jgi:acetyl-CoA acetyltransferase
MQYAMPYSRYLAIFGARREHMASFIVGNRANAQLNPESVFRGAPLCESDYLEDRWFAEPLSYLDSDMAVDGAGAVIVTTAERARSLRRPPAYVLGYGSIGVDLATTPVVTLESLEAGARLLASSLWASSGLGPANVDQANLYDGFSFFVYLWLEALGFCGRGEAFEFVQEGRVGLRGQLPLNTNGGSLGMGRLHGPAQVVEAVRQVQGLAGERQVAGARVTLACTGSPLNAGALLFTSDPSA